MSPYLASANGRAFAFAMGVSAVSAVCLGCAVESSSSGTSYGYAGSSSSGGSGSSSGGSIKPMLVVVDTGRTMNASPGQGVGVFTEYRAGGHWRVWWTCDTSKTSESCSFDVVATVSSGAIANVAGTALEAGDLVTQTSDQQIEAVTTTTAGVDGMTFDTPAGGIITLDARMDGQQDGSFLFFVQGGAINGGYKGTLTDPLMLEPSAP
jgi:hypothetical protein